MARTKMPMVAAQKRIPPVSDSMTGITVHNAIRRNTSTKSMINQGTNARACLNWVPRGNFSGIVMIYPDRYPGTMEKRLGSGVRDHDGSG
jgi:hypothetical protein